MIPDCSPPPPPPRWPEARLRGSPGGARQVPA